ncbi:MAG: acyltransferase [Clostridia bacterium]|nr:acyltransferase [Clostridia bacterium]
MQKERKTIQSLQGWRAIMMFIVVVGHLFGVNLVCGGAGEVMPFFFVLSGFVLTLAYNERAEKLTLRSEAAFLSKRIRKIYPLYFLVLLVCFAYYAALSLTGRQEQSVFVYLKYFIIDTVMLQSWIPIKDYYFSLNGVAWFLSSLVFSYALFLPFKCLTLKIRNKAGKAPAILLCAVLLITGVYLIVAKNVLQLEQYYTYVFPIFRAFEFFAGMVLAEIFLVRQQIKCSKKTSTILETLILLAFAAEYIIIKFALPAFGDSGYIEAVRLCLMCLLIYVFSFENGYISKAISNKFFLGFASISFEVYLIHQPLQNILGTGLNQLGLKNIVGIVTLVLSVVFAYLWKKVFSIIQTRKQKIK